MKKQLTSMISLTTVLILLSVAGCKKDVSNQQQPTSINATASVDELTYNSCGLAVNVFTPSATTFYNLAMPSGDVFIKFGIPGVAELDFQHIDLVTFESSGVYADKPKTVMLYRIKRTDGKYLSNAFGAANYGSKIEGAGSSTQLFIMNNLGGNKYNLILPTMSTCNFVNIYFDASSQKYRAAFVYSGQQAVGSKEIFILPAGTVISTPK